MSVAVKSEAPFIDEARLHQALQRRLNKRRGNKAPLRLKIEQVWFEEGCWRALVRRPVRKPVARAWDYATLLAEVEEEMYDVAGLNVMLTLARD